MLAGSEDRRVRRRDRRDGFVLGERSRGRAGEEDGLDRRFVVLHHLHGDVQLCRRVRAVRADLRGRVEDDPVVVVPRGRGRGVRPAVDEPASTADAGRVDGDRAGGIPGVDRDGLVLHHDTRGERHQLPLDDAVLRGVAVPAERDGVAVGQDTAHRRANAPRLIDAEGEQEDGLGRGDGRIEAGVHATAHRNGRACGGNRDLPALDGRRRCHYASPVTEP